MRRHLDSFCRDERGNVLMLFGLTMVPLLGIVGAAADYSIASNRKAQLQLALDQAGLVVANEPPATPDVITRRLTELVTAHLASKGYKPEDWSLTSAQEANNRVVAEATMTVHTTFMNLLNVSTMTVAAATEVARNSKIEVALVLDNTGSMYTNNRIVSLRTAATTLVNKLYTPANATTMVKVALVPFTATVNVKADTGFDMAWIDQQAQAKYHGVNFDLVNGAPANHLTLFDNLNASDTSNPKVTWKGCVEARAEPYDVDDTLPDATKPDTLFVPYFWPDEPDQITDSKGKNVIYEGATETNAYPNTYSNDNYTKTTTPKTEAPARQKSTGKYTKSHGAFPERSYGTLVLGSGPNKGCGAPLTPLTNNAQVMRDRIAAMKPWDMAGTNVAQGMMWGWSVLSPTAPFTEGAAYTDVGTQKVMIVLTDGENNVTAPPDTPANHNGSYFSSYGYLKGGRFGTTNVDLAIAEIDNKVKSLCTNIKAKGIRLYTITFELNSTTAQAMYRQCATNSSMYYNSPSTADLQGIFQKIADDLGNLRFSR